LAILLSSLQTTVDLSATTPPADAPVFAAYRTPAGHWSILAPCCRDLSGRIGVHRIAALEEPAATGGAEVIRLKEWAGVD
jgi:hypothetical protein